MKIFLKATKKNSKHTNKAINMNSIVIIELHISLLGRTRKTVPADIHYIQMIKNCVIKHVLIHIFIVSRIFLLICKSKSL